MDAERGERLFAADGPYGTPPAYAEASAYRSGTLAFAGREGVVGVHAVRLFLVPAAVVAGDGVIGTVRESNRRARGHGWTVLGLVLLFGIATWLLGAVPRVGALLSTALVAPVHAVAAAVLYEESA